jgi:hypothetical protein
MGEGKTGQDRMQTSSVVFLFYQYGCWIGRLFSKKGEEDRRGAFLGGIQKWSKGKAEGVIRERKTYRN